MVTKIFQSTLLQEERHSEQNVTITECKISIHAPTRGATTKDTDKALRHTISIHAPTRGATYKRKKHLDKGKISIHAPTRGAT